MAEEELTRREFLLDSIVDQNPYPIWIFDAEGTLIRINRACCDLLKIREEEVVGKYNVLKDNIVAEQGYLHLVESVFSQGKTVHFTLEYDSSRLNQLRLDRTAKVILEVTISPVKDESGRIINAIIMHRDITEYMQAQEQLRSSEARYRRIVETTHEGIWIIDADNRTTFANWRMAAMLGYSVDEMMGESLFSFMDEEWRTVAQTNVERRRRGMAEQHDFKFRRKDGTSPWALITTDPILDEAGQYAGALAMVTDITERKRMEEALQETNEALQALIHSSPLAIITIDPEGKVTLWNPAAERMFGWRESEALGQFLPLVPEDKLEEHRALRERVLRGEAFTNVEVRRRRKDGSPIDISLSTAPLRDAQGLVTGIMSVLVDITEHRKIEEALRESERRYRTLFETMAQGVVYQRADGHIVSANPAAQSILGLSLDQMRGRTSLDPRWRFIREDGSEFPGDQHPAMLALKSGKPVNGVVMGVFHPVFNEYRWILIDAIPEFRSGEGRPYQVFTTFTDITERKRAEEALKRSTRLLKESQGVARLGHYTFDVTTRRWESSEILDDIFGIDASYPKDQQGWRRLIHPDQRGEMSAYLLKNVLKKHQPFDREYKIIRPVDSKQRWVHERGRLEFDANGKPIQLLGTVQDISERKQLEEQLLQSQKMEAVGQLAGGVAHDFNNMLSVILGYAELIKSRLPESDPLLKDVIEIEKAAGHSRDITRQLLAFSRKQIIAPKTTNLNQLITATRKTLSRLIGEDIDLHFLPKKDLEMVRFDPAQLDQVLVNLAVNARDAMPDGGKLTIETANVELDEAYCHEHIDSRPGRYVLLVVSDDGVGMGRETLARIFEPFFTTKTIGEGTGLGLATVYGIIKQNGGFVNVYSEPGRGTTFKIYIPRIMEDSAAREKLPPVPPAAWSGTILLVEDDDMVRRLTSAMLEKLGYTVVAMETPSEALEYCKKEKTPLDLLMTDVVMPGMSGTELSHRIESFRPGIKVLYMSGYTPNVVVRHGVLEEGVHFVHKPFSLNDLGSKVREAIEGD